MVKICEVLETKNRLFILRRFKLLTRCSWCRFGGSNPSAGFWQVVPHLRKDFEKVMRRNNKMILANINGEASIYYGLNMWEELHADTFNPDTNYNLLELGNIHGKTYAEKKANARQKAVDFSLFDCCGLSWYELSIILNYFENIAERFGLVQEFKENGII